MGANNRQVGGTHYRDGAGVCVHCKEELQHWDLCESFNLDYFQGQIMKYIMRWHRKNGIQDLQKAQHFLERYIEAASRNITTLPEVGQEPDHNYTNQDQ